MNKIIQTELDSKNMEVLNKLNDREVVLEAVKNDRDILSIVSPIFQDDAEIVRAAILSNDYKARHTTILQDVSPRLRSNRNIVLKAVESFGLEIMYVNPIFFDDEEIILTAFENRRDDGSQYYGKPHTILKYIPPKFYKKIENRNNSSSIADKVLEKIANLTLYFDDYEKENRKVRRDRKEKIEKEWQETYKGIREKWNNSVVEWQEKNIKWQQNQKHESYVVFRAKLEQMPLYERWKQDVKEKCGNKCQLDKSHADRYAEVHHIDSLYLIYLESNLISNEKIIKCKKLWDIENGIVLCKECHDTMESSKNRQTLIQNK